MSVPKTEPTDGPTKTAAPTIASRRGLFVAIVGSYSVANLLIAVVFDVPEPAIGVLYGSIFGQITLLAVWTALGPARLMSRTLIGFGGATLVALALVAYVSRIESISDKMLYFAMVIVQWIVVQVPLWILRGAFGWRLCWPGEQLASDDRGNRQFGIGQLLTWTALVGITLGIGRFLILNDDVNFGGDQAVINTVFALVAAYNCLLAWPVVWSTMAPRSWWPWLVIASLACIILTIAEVVSLKALIGVGGDSHVFWVMNILHVVLTSAGLFAMRLGGFRLIRNAGQSD